MLSQTELASHLADAYEHLYDLVYLRTHPLIEALVAEPGLDRDELAWRLHHTLLDAIDRLNPGPRAPAFTREWRRHRLLVLRYVDGIGYAGVAAQLGISQRSYYREHKSAIEAVAALLRERAVAPSPEEPAAGRLELLRLETARIAQAGRYARIGEVVAGVLALLRDRLHARALTVEAALPPGLPEAGVDRSLLRQMLLGMLGYLADHAAQAVLRIEAEAAGPTVTLSLRVEPPSAVQPAPPPQVRERLAALAEMAALSGVQSEPLQAGEAIYGFHVHIVTNPEPTVLVVDDNEDVLELFCRYLRLHHYRPITARTAREALSLARRLHPHAITLDLMMPEQDGWDVLQTLLNQPGTRDIPVIVCSVLREKDLALSLGATAFLEKPVTEQALCAALQALLPSP